jgi:hypothetical protein
MSNTMTAAMRVRTPVRLSRETFERLTVDEAERLIAHRFRCFSEQGLGCKEALLRAVRPD